MALEVVLVKVDGVPMVTEPEPVIVVKSIPSPAATLVTVPGCAPDATPSSFVLSVELINP
ncbi:hypothetical protein ES703_101794 [subsurface metagenome]